MIDAMIPMLQMAGVAPDRIDFDKIAPAPLYGTPNYKR